MRLSILILSLACTAASIVTAENLPQRSSEWKLVWADEFNRDGRPDPKVWQFEQGFTRNKELQWYQPQNAVCQGGKLVITAQREKVRNPDFKEGHKSWKKNRWTANYTSASLITRPEYSWTYGRFEIRAKFSALQGMWPAIWTTGHGKWPHAGEIDIMEFYDGKILANTVHAGKNGRPAWNSSKTPISKFDLDTWNDQFHLWVMEWDEKEIAIYLNDRLLKRVDLTKTVNKDGPKINPFHAPQRLRLNLAIGSNGGDPSNTKFPQRYEIDYVRVYQK